MPIMTRSGDLDKVPYFIAPNWLFEGPTFLTPIERCVLANLFRRASKDEMTAFPSTLRIANDIGTSKPSVIKAIRSLIEKGCLEKKERFGEDGKQMSNLYSVNLNWKPQDVVEERPKSKRGSYPRVKSLDPSQVSLPSPVKSLDPPSQVSLPEVLPSISTTNTLSTKEEGQSGSSNPPAIPSEFEGLRLFLPGGTCYHTKWSPKFFEGFKEIADEWKRNCPLVDIKMEIGKAHTWCLTKGKVKKKLGSFLTNWMNTAQSFAERKNAGSTGPFQRQQTSRYLGDDPTRRKIFQDVEDNVAKLRAQSSRPKPKATGELSELPWNAQDSPGNV